jgi:UDP-N-acetylglucosamine 2-epimerase (non-hydrolysing)
MFNPEPARPAHGPAERLPVALLFGTRPEILKLAPVTGAFHARGLRPTLIFTGQHPHLAPAMFEETGMTPDHRLDLPGGLPPAQALGTMLTALAPLLALVRPRMLLVQGLSLIHI